MAGILIAATGASSAISSITIGKLSDRIGHTIILPVCLLGAALAYFPQGAVQDVWQLLGLRILLGLFLGGLMPSTYGLVSKIVPPERRGSAFGIVATATSLANFVGPLSAGGIATYWPLHIVFFVTGGLYALTFVWGFWGTRRHRDE
jgi:MFS family permease